VTKTLQGFNSNENWKASTLSKGSCDSVDWGKQDKGSAAYDGVTMTVWLQYTAEEKAQIAAKKAA